MEKLCPKLLYKDFVAILKRREVQGVQGLVLGGVGLAEYDFASSPLHSFQLMVLRDVDGAGPSWGGVRELRQDEGAVDTCGCA